MSAGELEQSIRHLWIGVGALAIAMGLMGFALCHSINCLRKALSRLNDSTYTRFQEQLQLNRNLIDLARKD